MGLRRTIGILLTLCLLLSLTAPAFGVQVTEVPTEAAELTEQTLPAEPEELTESEPPAEPETVTEAEPPTDPEDETEAESRTEPVDLTEAELPAEPETVTEAELPAEPEEETETELPTEPETVTEAELLTEPEDVTEAEPPADEVVEVVYNNPLYGEGEELETVEVTDLAAAEAALSGAGELTYYTTLEDAAVEMRGHMVARENEFLFGLRTDHLLEQADTLKQLIQLAVAQTGKPQEGDYLKWQYHSISSTFSIPDYHEAEGLYYYTVSIHPNWDKYDTMFDTTAAEEAEVDQRIASLRRSLFNAGMSDYEKAYAAYIYIMNTVAYGKLSDDSYHHYNCYGALVDQKAVCQGYALLFYRLMLEEGIDCRVISGWPDRYLQTYDDDSLHAWNIVRVGGVYYNLDVTWEDTHWQSNRPAFQYFLKSDDTFENHYRDDGTKDDRYTYAGAAFYAAYPMSKQDYAPTGPRITAAHSYSNGLSLSWSSVAGAKRYYLWRRVERDVKEPYWSSVTSTDKTSLILTGLKQGEDARYCVTAERQDGSMTFHTGLPMEITYDLLPEPTLTGASCVDNGVKVSWKAVSGAECYRVYYKADSGWKQAGTTTGTSFTVTGLTGGKTYRFTVRCVSPDNRYYASGYDSAGKSALYYPAPRLTGVKSTGTGVQVSWAAASGCQRYRVYYRKHGGSWKTAGETAKRTYLVKGLKNGVRYDFTVRCLAATGKPAGAYDKTGLDLTPAATPVLTGVQNVNGGVKVQWKSAAGAAQYRVYYKSAGGSWKSAGTTKKTSFTVTGLTGGRQYSFTVRCVSADGKRMASGYDSTGKRLTYLAAPVLTGVQNVNGGVKVQWKPSAGAAQYRVYYKTAKGGWKSAGTTKKTSFTVTGLTSGRQYSFTVRCISADGKQNTSGYDTVGLQLTHLSAPVLTGAKGVKGGVRVSWKQVTGAAQYRVYYKAAKGSWKAAGTTTGTSFTLTGLTSGKRYSFTVRCVSENGKRNTSGYDAAGLTAVAK